MDSVKNLLKKFSKLNALVVGDVMLDRYVWGRVDRISPEAPVPIVAVNRMEDRLGGAANVALNLKSLGANAFLCSVIGQDADGKALKKLLSQKGIDGNSCAASSNRMTTVKTRILSQNHQLLRCDFETTEDITDREERAMLERTLALIQSGKIDVVIFEDYNKGVLSEDLIEAIISVCNKKKIPVAVDPKKENFFSYKNVNLFKPNLRELHEGLGREINTDLASLRKADTELRKEINQQITLITLSDKGIFVSDGKKSEIIPAKKRSIADVSGAGDTVISVAALCLALKTDLHTLAYLSNLAGGLVCEEAGVVPIDSKKLLTESEI